MVLTVYAGIVAFMDIGAEIDSVRLLFSNAVFKVYHMSPPHYPVTKMMKTLASVISSGIEPPQTDSTRERISCKFKTVTDDREVLKNFR
jgi:hypothetical protein